jgi:23S rRNA pseudouridine1911/1915/1917 synthase
VHRLDKPTTGCLIVAKPPSAGLRPAFPDLQKQFEERTTKKKYLAIVSGVPEHTEATIDAPIGRNLTDRTKMSVLKTSASRDAKTTYRILDSVDDCSVLECDLHTGRTHQIRVHLSSVGHPILGDTPYGSPASKKLTDHYKVSGLCLHARSIVFVSPADDKEHLVEASLSSTITSALASTGLTV